MKSPTNTTSSEAETEVKLLQRIQSELVRYYGEPLILDAARDIMAAVDSYIEEATKQAERAFGGCRNCYGKGYATQRTQDHISPDFYGDVPYTAPAKIDMLFCNCDRGKQLKQLLTSNPAGEPEHE